MKYPKDIDPEWVPYLDRLNALPYLATTHSCTGHQGDPARESMGYLSLRVWDHQRFFNAAAALGERYAHDSFWISVKVPGSGMDPEFTVHFSCGLFPRIAEDITSLLEETAMTRDDEKTASPDHGSDAPKKKIYHGARLKQSEKDTIRKVDQP